MPAHPALLWTLRSIARLERSGGVRTPRLTEPGFERWHRVRRNLGWVDFVVLLYEDLAEAFPEPFDLRRWGVNPLTDLGDDEASALVVTASQPDDLDTQGFLRTAARALGLPAGGAFADMPRVQPHHRALELPGGGGRLAVWQVQNHPGLAFHDQFTFVADTVEERVTVGLAAVEVRASTPRILSSITFRDVVGRGARFDKIFGLNGHPGAYHLARELGMEVRWV